MKFEITKYWTESRYFSVIVEASSREAAEEAFEAADDAGEIEWYDRAEYGDGDGDVDYEWRQLPPTNTSEADIVAEEPEEEDAVTSWPENPNQIKLEL